jgi:hypothetical protein
MTKVAIIMARGIEGCGVTKYTVEQVKWLKAHGYQTKVYASKDKTFARKNAHDLGDVDLFKFADGAQIDRFIEECNNSDYIFINSLPALGNGRGAGAGDEAIDNWVKALKAFKKPVILIQHDHTIYSIKRNAALDEAIEAADLIFAHARTNDFSDYVKERDAGSSLMSFFGEEESDSKKILNFQPGLDFELNRKKYWKDIDAQDPLHHKWIGRCTSWKGFDLMFEWHNNYLMPNQHLTTFEGIEKSPAFLAFKEISKFYNEIKSDPNGFDLSQRYGDIASVFGPYVNDGLLDRMSRSGFGYQLSILKQKFIEKSIEYTHCEVASVGTVPVFRKEYGELAVHRVTGDPLSKSKDNFTIWLSKEKADMEESINMVKRLAADPVLRDEWREGAYAFYKAHQDSEYVFEDLMKQVKDNL